jgi:hypothetical protein
MKKVVVSISLVILGIFVSGFSNSDSNSENLNFTEEISTVPTEEESISLQYTIPFVGKGFTGFREAVAFKESQGKYDVVNSLGYLGKYQFGKSTLKRFKIYNTQDFLSNPALQEDAFIALCSLNKWILRKDIQRSVGKKINGIEITESGILAAAHLSGAGNVKKYLRSGGKITFKDAFGSSVQHYLKRFSGYDTSFIKANRKPVI